MVKNGFKKGVYSILKVSIFQEWSYTIQALNQRRSTLKIKKLKTPLFRVFGG